TGLGEDVVGRVLVDLRMDRCALVAQQAAPRRVTHSGGPAWPCRLVLGMQLAEDARDPGIIYELRENDREPEPATRADHAVQGRDQLPSSGNLQGRPFVQEPLLH